MLVARLRSRATITQRRDRGPMRPVGRRRGVRPGGLYPSAKVGRMIGWESRNELWGFYHAEVDPRVVSYRAQPHTAEAIVDGVRLVYTPDREDLFETGRPCIVEVKEAFEAARDPDYAHKLTFFAELYRSLGWEFRLEEAAELTAEPRFGAVTEVQRLRRAMFTVEDLGRVRAALADGPKPMADLVGLFSSELLARSMLCAMMVARRVAIDLSAGLTWEAAVRLL